MAGKRKRRIVKEAEHSFAENVPAFNPNAATGQGALRDTHPTSLGLLSSDTTNVTAHTDSEEEQQGFATTPSALADKHLLSKIQTDLIPFLLFLVAGLGIAGIDNYQGRLNTQTAMWQLVWKWVALGGFTGAVLLLYLVYHSITKRLK